MAGNRDGVPPVAGAVQTGAIIAPVKREAEIVLNASLFTIQFLCVTPAMIYVLRCCFRPKIPLKMRSTDPQGFASPRRILIVEDNKLHIKMMRDVLDFYGYTTLIARAGAVAVDIARRQQPDLILLDIRLPDIDGAEVAGRLKADHRTRATPIIAVTAFAMPNDRRRLIDSGCDDYIAKPVSIAAILALVEQYTARRAGGDVR